MRSSGVILDDGVYRFAGKKKKKSGEKAFEKTFDDRYLKGDGVTFHIYALVVSKKKPKLDGFKKLGRKAPIPSEVSRDLTEQQKDYLDKNRGHVWFFKIEKEGWDWTSAGGVKGAKKVQDAINYLKRFKEKDKVAGVEAVYVEIGSENMAKKKTGFTVEGSYHANGRIITAGWWGQAPMSGDTPLDMLYVLEQETSPKHGALLLQEWLSGNDEEGGPAFDPAETMYAALGLWDHVVTTGPEEWRDAFMQLKPRIQNVARRLQSDSDDDFGAEWIREYAKGNIASQVFGGRLYGESFWPGGRTWYINDAYVDYHGDDEVSIRLEVRQLGADASEYEIHQEDIPGPENAIITDADIENFGGSEGGQQSALLTIQYQYEEDDSYGSTHTEYGSSDAQIDVDPETGEVENISINWDY